MERTGPAPQPQRLSPSVSNCTSVVDTKPNQVQDTKTNLSSETSLGVAGGSTGVTRVDQSFIATQDDAVMDASVTQEVVDLLNEQLSSLLCLPSRQFWRKVVMDESLSVFLDSYLQYRKRWFDFPAGSSTESEVSVVVGDGDLSRRAFMLLLRMSSNVDPGSSSSETLSAIEHAAILKEKKLLSIPMLMDISAIYGHDNPDLTRRLVSNAFKAQPGFADDLAAYIFYPPSADDPSLLERIITMHQRCCDTVQDLTGSREISTILGGNRVHRELLEMVDYLNDVVFTLNAFILVYPPAANVLITSGSPNSGQALLLPALATIHDTLLPNLQAGFAVLASSQLQQTEEKTAFAQVRLNKLRETLEDVVWLLIENRYLGGSFGDKTLVTETTASDVDEDIIAKGDSLVQAVVTLAMGPSEEVSTKSGGVRLVCTGSLLKSMERRHGLSYQIQQACQRGLLLLDNAQQDYVSALVMDDEAAVGGSGLIETRRNDIPRLTMPEREGDEETVIRQSKISQVKDLFPDFGDGFVDACLEVYDNDPEKVIQRILEGTLHPDLVSLDRTLAAKPARLVKPPPVKDKGKGKVFEMSEAESVWEDKPISAVGASSTVTAGDSSSSSSAASRGKAPVSNITVAEENAGRYVRRQRGDDESFNLLLDSRSGKEELQRAIKAAAARVEYEDEYDDSFDELGQYVADAGGIEETESLADLVGSRGGARSIIVQSRNSGKPSPITPWGASSLRDRQSAGDGQLSKGSFQSGERQHAAGAPSGKGEYQRGEREQLAGGSKSNMGLPRGDRLSSANAPRSNAETHAEKRYSAGASNGNVEVQRGDRRFSAGTPRVEEGQRRERQYRPVNSFQSQEGDRQKSGGVSSSSSSNVGYESGSPVPESEGQANETQATFAAGRGRGGRGNRGRGKNRGPQPKSDFYLRDGKLYSYKVAGAVGVGSVEEAEAIKREERETIYGLGEGGNIPRQQDGSEGAGKQDASDNSNTNYKGEGGRGRGGYGRGRGDPAGRGRGRGGNDDHRRKDKAMQKHFAGLSGF